MTRRAEDAAIPHAPSDRDATPREVVLVVFDGVQLLDVAGPADVFDAADRVTGGGSYRLRTVAPSGAVRASNGIRLQVDADLTAPLDGVDTVIVAGGWGTDDSAADPALVEFVARASARARRTASVCTGAFVLAAAGVLDGRAATTHWSRVDDLGAAVGDGQVAPDRLFVRDGPVWTSAGVASGVDLALSLVEDDHGPDVARQVARWLVVFLHRSGGQSQFSPHVRRPATAVAPLRDALARVAADPAGDHRLEVLADAVGLSVRQLTRLFRAHLGTSVRTHVEQVRVEAARRRLESTRDPVAAVARAVGFGSDEAMRQAFVRTLGVPPSDYRDRFGSTAGR